jgi:two-component sensor histidine kinase
MLPADRAVALGLVLTELVIKVNKYAYGGAAGPLLVTLSETGARFRLVVADEGVGRSLLRKGLGSRMLRPPLERRRRSCLRSSITRSSSR